MARWWRTRDVGAPPTVDFVSDAMTESTLAHRGPEDAG
jgi:hypothetical protein